MDLGKLMFKWCPSVETSAVRNGSTAFFGPAPLHAARLSSVPLPPDRPIGHHSEQSNRQGREQ